MARHTTNLTGVIYRDCITNGKADKVYYIRYKDKNKKTIERNVPKLETPWILIDADERKFKSIIKQLNYKIEFLQDIYERITLEELSLNLNFSTLYKKYVAENNIDIYSSKRAQIPIPRYIIFYNGRQEMPERCTLRLSDAFVKKSDNYNSNQVTASDTSSNCNSSKFQPAMEITAHMININIGNNAELMEKCRLLHDYAVFIGLIRDYISQENDINTAVTLAINQAISHNILKEVLSMHTAEVRDMILTEYNEEQHIKNEKNISYDDGFNDGVECGIERGIIQGVEQGTQMANTEAIKNMIKLNVPKDKILECYSEEEYNSALNDTEN